MKIKLLYTFGAIALGLLSTNSFSQSTPFVPQVKDWGTYLPVGTIPDPGLVNPNGHRLKPVLNSRGDIIISWGGARRRKQHRYASKLGYIRSISACYIWNSGCFSNINK